MIIKILSITLVLFNISAASAAINPQVESCKNSINNAANTIQSIANQVPNRAFGKFTKNGRWLPLVFAVTGIGGGNPQAGAKILFQQAKPYLDKNKSQIFKAANACVGTCDVVRSLKKQCDEVQDLAALLRNLDFNRAYEIAQAIGSYGGTDGVKRSVAKEVADYYKDRN
jgi:hypothetical protein